MRADLAYTSKRLLMFVSTCSRRSMRPSEQTAGVVAQLYPGWSTYCTCIATRNLLPATIGGNDTAAAGERPHGKRTVQQQGGLSAPWATTEQPAAAAQTKGNLSAPWATNEPPAAAPRKDSRPAPWATNEPQAHAREPLMSRNKSKREQEGAGKVREAETMLWGLG
mmetsp:Transcript_15973/g.47362  ORF Transcript_15973/g.47362 Transcript_15973/m.47362 type:complete len:166 (-) Transcript_15973:1206-1703(-)